ncbi:MAG TPA: hypothetical protein VER03_18035 [Bryobacteraceae bacterium]|nr:hypothetical protein [Bryobacteraceae bacterium]
MRTAIGLLSLAVLSSAASAAISIPAVEFTTGVATGAIRMDRASTQKVGDIEFPIWDFIDDNDYTFQQVDTGSDSPVSTAYLQVTSTKNTGFNSAYANGKPILEVGSQDRTIGYGINGALARYMTRIKNNSDDDIDGLGFQFVIPDGKVEIEGTRFENRDTARARVGASIEYLLRTPDQGTYVDSTGVLFNMYVDITNEGRRGKLESNFDVKNFVTSRSLLYLIPSYEGFVYLPKIPAYGELTFYYDMYSYFRNYDENVGLALLGDPAGLVYNPRGLVLSSPVPEPSAIWPLALLAIAVCSRWVRRKGRWYARED